MKCKLLPCPRALPPCALLTISRAARRYSPMHLWTKQARKEALFAPNQSTPFSKRCQVYYHIRKNMEEDPSTINLSYDALRKAASTSESRKRSRQGPDDGGGDVDGGDEDGGSEAHGWYSRAVELCQKFL